MQKDNIILIGFMGAGKTTFGKWISKNHNYEFCDTDEYIEKKENMTINDIFAGMGELAFRDMETQAVKDLYDQLTRTVISVGGGLPVREENRKLLKKLGTVVYLKTSKDVLVKRLKEDKSRPLLAGGDIEVKIERLMSAREDMYKDAAHVVIDTENMTFEEMYHIIKGELKS